MVMGRLNVNKLSYEKLLLLLCQIMRILLYCVKPYIIVFITGDAGDSFGRQNGMMFTQNMYAT